MAGGDRKTVSMETWKEALLRNRTRGLSQAAIRIFRHHRGSDLRKRCRRQCPRKELAINFYRIYDIEIERVRK